jgi:hypothetical protein
MNIGALAAALIFVVPLADTGAQGGWIHPEQRSEPTTTRIAHRSMLSIMVKTPFDGEPLTFTWQDRRMNVSGSKNAFLIWVSIRSQGLYGKVGPILDPENRLFTDLVIAQAKSVGPDDYSLNEQADAPLQREADCERRHPILQCAVT